VYAGCGLWCCGRKDKSQCNVSMARGLGNDMEFLLSGGECVGVEKGDV
jgi:hypothetical protein